MSGVERSTVSIRLYTFSDSRFARLKQRFMETLVDDYEVVHIDFSDFASAAGDTLCGIQFFAPTRPLVEKGLACHDIVSWRCAAYPRSKGYGSYGS